MKENPLRILIAALDWGMGHSTRIIPLAREFHLRNAQLYFAGESWQLALFEEAFPRATMLPLPGYKVSYGRRLPASWHVVRQFPRLRSVIRSEQHQVRKYVESLNIDMIISDNRYGVWDPACKNIMVIHQLIPPVKTARRLVKPLLWQAHQRFLKPFDELLIPDRPDRHALAAAMRPDPLPHNSSYIGWLSRMQGIIPATPPFLPTHLPAPDVLALLSGPEPQRSVLEAQLKKEIAGLGQNVWIVQGIPGQQRLPRQIPGGMLIPYMNAQALAWWLPKAGTVVARSGYSSIMDFSMLGLRNIVLVPTRGQPEQEHLARMLEQANRTRTWKPGRASLESVLSEQHDSYGFRKLQAPAKLLRDWVGEWFE